MANCRRRKSVNCFSIKAEEQFSLAEISHTFNIPPDFCFSGLTIANSGFPSKSLSSIGI